MGFWGGVFLQWKKKEHLEYLLAEKIKTTGTDEIFCGECLSISLCSEDYIKPKCDVI